MTGKDALLLRAIAFNGMDEEKSPNTALLGWDYDPRNARHELAEWLKDNEQTIGVEYDEENAPNVDNIYAHIIDTFGHPGVSLIDITITEINSNKYWSFYLLDKDLPPAAYHVDKEIDILCALQFLAKHDIHISNTRFEVDVFYVRMTSLGREFLTKCDYEWKQKLS